MGRALNRIHKSCSHGDPFRPKGQCSGKASPVCKSSCGNNRNSNRIGNAWNQYQGCDITPVGSRLMPCDDNRIGSPFFCR